MTAGEGPQAAARTAGGGPEAGAQGQRALDLAYRYLGKRDRTVAEVRRHLETKQVAAGDAGAAVDELARQGYLDDARYAQRYVEDRRTLDAWGSERIERRLIAAGVDAEIVAAALAVRGPDEELDAAVALLRRRLAAAPATDRDLQRALSLLVRKGFELDLAYDAVRALSASAEAA